MNLSTVLEIQGAQHSRCTACTLLVKGFSKSDEAKIRTIMHVIPSKFLGGVGKIVNEHLYPKHGKFVPDGPLVEFDERVFKNKQKWGNSPNSMTHAEMTLCHEIGHSVFTNLSDQQQEAWKKLSGWQDGKGEGQAPPYSEKRSGWPKETQTVTHSKDAKFTRHYAEKNWNEDFADCFSWYVNGHGDELDEGKRNFIAGLMK